MNWVTNLDESTALRKIFGGVTIDPRCEVMEARLQRDGPSVIARLNLRDYPNPDPVKWRQAKANTVQIELAMYGVTRLEIKNLDLKMVADIQLDKNQDGSELTLNSKGSSLFVAAEFSSVHEISAYLNGERARGLDPFS